MTPAEIIEKYWDDIRDIPRQRAADAAVTILTLVEHEGYILIKSPGSVTTLRERAQEMYVNGFDSVADCLNDIANYI